MGLLKNVGPGKSHSKITKSDTGGRGHGSLVKAGARLSLPGP